MIYPQIGQTKTNFIFFQEIFAIVWSIRGVNQNNFFFLRGKSKKNLQEKKPEMTYITEDKDVLTSYF